MKDLDKQIQKIEFVEACQDGNFDKVEYLISNRNSGQYKDMEMDLYNGFLWACAYGRLDVVRFLLQTQDMKESRNFIERCNSGIRTACKHAQMNVVEYLVNRPEYDNIKKLSVFPDMEEWVINKKDLMRIFAEKEARLRLLGEVFPENKNRGRKTNAI